MLILNAEKWEMEKEMGDRKGHSFGRRENIVREKVGEMVAAGMALLCDSTTS